MVKQDVSVEEKAQQPQWYSSHLHIHGEALEKSCLDALTQQLPVDIEPTKIIEYTDDGLESIEPNVLYIPQVTNQAAIDSFILVSDFFYLFQITIASTHGINHQLIDVAEKLHFPNMDMWHVVFIILPNLTLKVPQP